MNTEKLKETVYVPISRGARMDLKILAATEGIDMKDYLEKIINKKNELRKKSKSSV